MNLCQGITYGSQASLKFERRQETRGRGLKVKGSITAEIDLFVAAVGATIELGIENQEKLTTNTMQCEFMGNYTGAELIMTQAYQSQIP